MNSEEKCEYNLRLSAKWKYLYIILKRQRVKEMKYDSVCEKKQCILYISFVCCSFSPLSLGFAFQCFFLFFWHYFVVLFDSIRYSCVYLKMIQHEKIENPSIENHFVTLSFIKNRSFCYCCWYSYMLVLSFVSFITIQEMAWIKMKAANSNEDVRR